MDIGLILMIISAIFEVGTVTASSILNGMSDKNRTELTKIISDAEGKYTRYSQKYNDTIQSIYPLLMSSSSNKKYDLKTAERIYKSAVNDKTKAEEAMNLVNKGNKLLTQNRVSKDFRDALGVKDDDDYNKSITDETAKRRI